MRSLSVPVIALLFVGCQFQASCGGKKLNMENAVTFVSTTLEKEVGQKPTAVTCPDAVAIKTGGTFECKAAFGAPTATVVIAQDDDQGNVTIQSITGILIAAKLEKQVADTLGPKLGATLTVACGDRVRTATVGEKFTCEAKDAEGGSGTVTVTTKDVTGNVSFEIGPKPAPEAAAPAAGSAAPAEPAAAEPAAD